MIITIWTLIESFRAITWRSLEDIQLVERRQFRLTYIVVVVVVVSAQKMFSFLLLTCDQSFVNMTDIWRIVTSRKCHYRAINCL